MKYAPCVGDTGVIGVVDGAFFIAAVTANGYDSVQQDKLDPQLRFCCSVPNGISTGDWVTADIVQGNDAPYAGNIQAL